MTMFDEQAKAAFASAADWSKQILTLSTGIVTLTVAFADKIFGDLSTGEKAMLWTAWVLYLLSIVGGVWLLGALTGSLSSTTPPNASGVYASNTLPPALLQLGAFLLATIAIVAFGFSSVGNTKAPKQTTTTAVGVSFTESRTTSL
jgi:hypothetical protein